MALYRKKPVTVQAVQWTGGNPGEIYELAGRENFDVLDDQDRANCDDPEATATVFDRLHSTWVLVKIGQWIIKGVKGELYPCDAAEFAETYEPIPEPDSGSTTIIPPSVPGVTLTSLIGVMPDTSGDADWWNVPCDAAQWGSSPSMLDGRCRCLVCPRCRHHTGNSYHGHYGGFCQVTGTTRESHMCCPDPAFGCELEAAQDTTDGAAAENVL